MADYINSVYEYDHRLLKEYQMNCEYINLCKEQLELEKEILDGQKSSVEQEQQRIEQLITEKNQQITAYESDINSKEKAIAEYEREIAEQRAMKLMEHEAVSRALPGPHCGWVRVKISRHRASGPEYEAGRKLIRLMCKECGCSTNYEKTLWEAECKWNKRMAQYTIDATKNPIKLMPFWAIIDKHPALLSELIDVEKRGICSNCEHNKDSEFTPTCENADYDCTKCNEDCICRRCIDGSEWRWRGIQTEKPANVCR